MGLPGASERAIRVETDRVDRSGVAFLVEDLHTRLQVPQPPGVVKPAAPTPRPRFQCERKRDRLTMLLPGIFLRDGRQCEISGGCGLLALPSVCHWGRCEVKNYIWKDKWHYLCRSQREIEPSAAQEARLSAVGDRDTVACGCQTIAPALSL